MAERMASAGTGNSVPLVRGRFDGRESGGRGPVAVPGPHIGSSAVAVVVAAVAQGWPAARRLRSSVDDPWTFWCPGTLVFGAGTMLTEEAGTIRPAGRSNVLACVSVCHQYRQPRDLLVHSSHGIVVG